MGPSIYFDYVFIQEVKMFYGKPHSQQNLEVPFSYKFENNVEKN